LPTIYNKTRLLVKLNASLPTVFLIMPTFLRKDANFFIKLPSGCQPVFAEQGFFQLIISGTRGRSFLSQSLEKYAMICHQKKAKKKLTVF
jgi:hypothetical protein